MLNPVNTEHPPSIPCITGRAMDDFDFLAALDDDEQQPSQALAIIPERETSVQPVESLVECEGSAGKNTSVLQMACMKGKVGKGRYGDKFERSLLTTHARACKYKRKSHSFSTEVAELLDECKLSKHGQKLSLKVKANKSVGIRVTIQKASSRGNRFVRLIAWSQFLAAAYGTISQGASNVAAAARVGVHPGTAFCLCFRAEFAFAEN